jgi:hypothetical protein
MLHRTATRFAHLASTPLFGFGSLSNKGPQLILNNPNLNKYQENQMLFLQDKKTKKGDQLDITRPRTIQEIKKLQDFVKSYKTEEGKSLN